VAYSGEGLAALTGFIFVLDITLSKLISLIAVD
jgi:hypothetical protein